MTARTTNLKQEAIDNIVGVARERLSGARAETGIAFLRHYYDDIAAEDITGVDPEDLYGAALSLWQFGAKHKPGEAKIRAFNPRVEQHGWHSPHTVVEIVHDDMPFLVDSVTMELNRRNLTVHLVVHPQFSAERDASGKASALRPRGNGAKGAANESFMHIEIDEQTSPRILKDIEQGLDGVLADVRASVAGWRTMRDRAAALVDEFRKSPPAGLPRRQADETVAFLRWLLEDHYTFLGFREMKLEGSGKDARINVLPESCVGMLRDPEVSVFRGLRKLGRLPGDVQDYLREPTMVVMAKTNRRSTVHRPVHMDAVAIKKFNKKAEVVGIRLFVGLFSSAAYSQSPREIPLLRRKVHDVMALAGYDEKSHAGKALLHILDTFPRDELFQFQTNELSEISRGIVQLQERQRIALFLRRDPFERFISAYVYVPRERFNTGLRVAFERILTTAFDGEIAGRYTHMSDDVLSRLHFIINTTPGKVPDYDAKELESRLVEAGRSWADRLKSALVESMGEEKGLKTQSRYEDAFPVSYTEAFSAHTAVFDIKCIDEALKTDTLGMNLYHPIEAAEDEFQFKIYRPGSPVPLSDILPMLENMGLRVLGERPYDVILAADGKAVAIQDFDLVSASGEAIDFDAIRQPFHDSFARIWRGEMENDGFNRLVIAAGLSWRQVVVLRACCKYLRQAAIPFSQDYMAETLARNGGIAALLARLFECRFDPDLKGDREAEEARLAKKIIRRLAEVENLDEDRIIRHFLNLIQTTLRTNFYQTGDDGLPKPWLSLKFDSQRIDSLPEPRPFREIFVYSPRVEGVHMRFGPVARGGMRWSDRREDFRTEILGLVKAQQVKNAVIVPVGSKGGFVLKQAPSSGDREALLAEGIACYRIFVSGMLDITDNRVGDEVAPPARVLRKDGDDPYLVVAADKGTATFSDIANGLARDYGFWLDDAFASGGSAGYDHKKMGITARGVWESVKRHFRETGHDTQTRDFTVIGVGDMSGDVFGNGMLLSEHIKLVGAFNHLHIFVDPDPDPKKSFAERKRLFELPRSSWADYQAKLISKGGGVFDRRAKSVDISPRMKSLFGIKEKQLTPARLIRAMLTAEVDLLWFGGIGTYVKSSRETHADAGDRANDSLRVDAASLRCKVIGEGANLGMTQRARIEFAMAGGRLNTDAIDNSAGVDTSDHEVNIKILLSDAIARKELPAKQRDALLAGMTEEVAALVLRDNYQQTQSITVTRFQDTGRLDEQQRLMRSLERAGRLDRALEFLPNDEEIAERHTAGQALTRPELAVLLAYAKIVTYDALLASDLPDDPLLGDDLARYFPAPIQRKFPAAIGRHRLRREIITTHLTNSIINRTGPGFINEMQHDTGMDVPEIVRGYTISREVFELRALWQDIEALDNIAPAEAQTRMLLETVRTLWRTTPWFLRNCVHPLDITAHVGEFREGVQRIAAGLDEMLTAAQRKELAVRGKRFAGAGVPSALVARVGWLKVLSSAPDIVRIAGTAKQPVEDAGAAYFLAGDRFRLDWLRRAANAMPAENHWQRQARDAIVDDIWGHQYNLTSAALATGETGADAIGAWTAARIELVEQVDLLLGEIVSSGAPDLAMLAVANRQLRALAGS